MACAVSNQSFLGQDPLAALTSTWVVWSKGAVI